MKFQVFSFVPFIFSMATVAQNLVAGANYEVLANVGVGCYCLTKSTTPKNKLIMSHCNSSVGSTQRIGGDSNIDYTTGYSTLQFYGATWLVDVSGASKAVGAEVLIYEKNSQANQLWTFLPVQGFVQVVNENSGLCLTVNLYYPGKMIIMQDTCKVENTLQLWDYGNEKCGAHHATEN